MCTVAFLGVLKTVYEKMHGMESFFEAQQSKLTTTIRTLNTNCSKLTEQYGIIKFAVALIPK